MTAPESPRRPSTGRWELLLALVLQTVLQLRMVLADGIIERDPEELFNAGQAWLALHGDLGWLFAMQYRPFCGGCTVHAATAMGLFSVLPPVELVYKLIPLAWSLAGLALGWALLDRHRGRAGARLWALLWLLAPTTWAHLSLIGWGNHMEAGIVVLGAALLALEGGALTLGIVLGLGIYLSFSAGFGLVAVGLWLALGRQWSRLARVLAGVPLGLLGWGLQWLLAGEHAFHTIYAEHESVPDPRRLPAELWTLLAPRQLAGLFGAGSDGLGFWTGVAAGVLGLGALVGLLLRGRGGGRLLGLLGASFLLVYGLTDFSVKVAESGVMYPGGLRYAAPLFVVFIAVFAWSSAGLWSRGRRALALALLVPWLLSGALGRAQVWQRAISGDRLQRSAVDWRYLRERLSYVFDAPAHLSGATAADPWTAALHGYGLGREGIVPTDAALKETEAYQEGVGERLLRPQPGAAVPPELAALEGVAAQAGLLRIWGTIDPSAWPRPLAQSHPARIWVEGYVEGVRRAADSPSVPLVLHAPAGLDAPQARLWADGLGRGLGEAGGPSGVQRALEGELAAVVQSSLQQGIAREWWTPSQPAEHAREGP